MPEKCEVYCYRNRPTSLLLVRGNLVINGMWPIKRMAEGVFGCGEPLDLLGKVWHGKDYNATLETFEKQRMERDGKGTKAS